MKRNVAIFVIVLAGVAFLAGYWPERQRRLALEAQLTSMRVELEGAQTRVRLGGLLGQLLAAEDMVSAQNYGEAQALSSKLFDAVRAEATRTAAGSSKNALEKVVLMRDTVTASLTRGDPQALTQLREAESLVRSALGFPLPAVP